MVPICCLSLGPFCYSLTFSHGQTSFAVIFHSRRLLLSPLSPFPLLLAAGCRILQGFTVLCISPLQV
ncbi:hypothetical protein I79_025005 [Cricetulus griseus]|uniref:Uncharacterized protein n=1 Tax=Cricetulus griseus TaxID=10029 RepID=G3IM73_CRIGR|nr:hypothetical protein I79_025005 [Cricetulus griseus]